jgi:hypothetical protein
MANVSDVHTHRETKRRPIDLYEEEHPYLLLLPAHSYDSAEVLYRTVDAEGYVAYRQNLYSVPWERIGELLPVRVTENELVVYGPDIIEIARHELFPSSVRGEKRTDKRHQPERDVRLKHEVLKRRFEELGPKGGYFFEELVKSRRYGRGEAQRILALLSIYQRDDLAAAIERCSRYRAFSLTVVERILAAQARPRSSLELLDSEARTYLGRLSDNEPMPARPMSDTEKDAEKDDDPGDAA